MGKQKVQKKKKSNSSAFKVKPTHVTKAKKKISNDKIDIKKVNIFTPQPLIVAWV